MEESKRSEWAYPIVKVFFFFGGDTLLLLDLLGTDDLFNKTDVDMRVFVCMLLFLGSVCLSAVTYNRKINTKTKSNGSKTNNNNKRDSKESYDVSQEPDCLAVGQLVIVCKKGEGGGCKNIPSSLSTLALGGGEREQENKQQKPKKKLKIFKGKKNKNNTTKNFKNVNNKLRVRSVWSGVCNRGHEMQASLCLESLPTVLIIRSTGNEKEIKVRRREARTDKVYKEGGREEKDNEINNNNNNVPCVKGSLLNSLYSLSLSKKKKKKNKRIMRSIVKEVQIKTTLLLEERDALRLNLFFHTKRKRRKDIYFFLFVLWVEC
eukprot:gene9855-6927_t